LPRLFKCSCGIERNSPNAHEEIKFSKFAWLALIFGISAKPISVEYRCKSCHKVFDRLESEELQNFRA
jgi:hypothetical protein